MRMSGFGYTFGERNIGSLQLVCKKRNKKITFFINSAIIWPIAK